MYAGTVKIRSTTWEVEIATTASEIAQGLSGRASLTPLHGMLFDMATPQPEILINMQQMLFELSIVFMDEDLNVIAVTSAVPGTNFLATFPGIPGARYFMEVRYGELTTAEVTIGDTATISGYAPPNTISIDALFNLMIMMMIVSMMMGAMNKMLE